MGFEDPSRNCDIPTRRGIVVAKGYDRSSGEICREPRHPIFSNEACRLAVILNQKGAISAPKKTIYAFNGRTKVVYAENAKIYGDLGIWFIDSPWNSRPTQIYWFIPELGDCPDETLKSLHCIWFDSRLGASAYPYIPYPARYERIFMGWDLQQWDAWLRWLLSWMGFESQMPMFAKETYLMAYPPANLTGEEHRTQERLQAVYTYVPLLPEAWILKNHPPYIKECRFCKRPIINIDPRRDYCNQSCKNKAYRDRKEKNGTIFRRGTCIHCGEPLQEKRGGAKFCSDRCRQAHHRHQARGCSSSRSPPGYPQ